MLLLLFVFAFICRLVYTITSMLSNVCPYNSMEEWDGSNVHVEGSSPSGGSGVANTGSSPVRDAFMPLSSIG